MHAKIEARRENIRMKGEACMCHETHFLREADRLSPKIGSTCGIENSDLSRLSTLPHTFYRRDGVLKEIALCGVWLFRLFAYFGMKVDAIYLQR